MSKDPGGASESTSKIPSIEDRMKAGQALRERAPRSSHGEWTPTDDRPDPIALLVAEAGPLKDLLPLRYERMLASPFAFLRGSAVVMASDLKGSPISGLTVQLSGDAHLANFGVYETAECRLVFDLNDFDETLAGPWEWDLKRLITSVVVAGRGNNFTPVAVTEAALAAARSYRVRISGLARQTAVEVFHTRIGPRDIVKPEAFGARKKVEDEFSNARELNVQALDRSITTAKGKPRFKDSPPVVEHVKDPVINEGLPDVLTGYVRSLASDRAELYSRHTLIDSVRRVVGVGSVGTRCYALLLLATSPEDRLFLQIKEARQSVLEPFIGGRRHRNNGRRVVDGQRLIQAATDPFLGWTRTSLGDFYLRQLRDTKITANIASLSPSAFASYGEVCGWALALSHARSGDPAMISGYLGVGDQFDKAVVDFAKKYADQTDKDYASLQKAVKQGRIKATVKS